MFRCSKGKALKAATFTTSISKSFNKHLPSRHRELATAMVLVLPMANENLVPALPRIVGIWLNDNTDAKFTVTRSRIAWAPCRESC